MSYKTDTSRQLSAQSRPNHVMSFSSLQGEYEGRALTVPGVQQGLSGSKSVNTWRHIWCGVSLPFRDKKKLPCDNNHAAGGEQSGRLKLCSYMILFLFSRHKRV